MPKRFTETEKWKDKWFRQLRPEYKLAFLYLLDNCDHAGIIDLDEQLADFQIGATIDWTGFFLACGDRIASVHGDKKILTRFIEFQYGELSQDCKAHNPVFASLQKHRVSKGYPKGIQRVQDKDKDKDKDKVKDKEGECEGERSGWSIPERLDSPRVRELLSRFEQMRRKIKKPIRDFANSSLVLDRFDDESHLVYALETCIANDYQGLKPEYRQPTNGKPTVREVAF